MKRIAIIGGGISGLAVLHFLKKRLPKAQIVLYERESSIGGTIRTIRQNNCLFEWGPNGFLDNQPATLQLIEDLGLQSQLVSSQTQSRRHFIQISRELYTPGEYVWSLPFKEKCALLAGIFKQHISKDQSIHDYISQRFSVRIAENLVDPLMAGIYAGNIKRLHMASSFPKFKRRGLRKPRMLSLGRGMGQLMEILTSRYRHHIRTDTEISAMPDADITIVSTPAYAAARIVEHVSLDLSMLLDQMPYAPVAVAGLLFKQDSFKNEPEGFGYLVPSKENKSVLGVLIESHVFARRAEPGQVMMRVMIGGSHHPAIINDSQEQILSMAIKEIDDTYGLLANPQEGFIKIWPKAIPQYETQYPQWRGLVAQACAKTPGLYLCANYLDGVSFNDCVANAQKTASSVNI